MSSKWDESKFDDSDPRNIMLDPATVLESYKKLTAKGKDPPVNLFCLTA